MVYLLSLLGAMAYAWASALQQLAASTAPVANMSFGLLRSLMNRRVWLLGMVCDALGYVLQALALAFGPLALVEPLFVTGLLFALPIGAALRRTRLRPSQWVAASAVTLALAGFIRVTQPTDGNYDIKWTAWLAFAVVVGLCAVLAWMIGRGERASFRAALIGLCTGISLAFTAALTKYLTELWTTGGIAAIVSTPALYVLVIAGVLALVMSQSAFQAGPLTASLPALAISAPVITALVGMGLFHEHINAGSGVIVVAVTAACAMTIGVVVLARDQTG